MRFLRNNFPRLFIGTVVGLAAVVSALLIVLTVFVANRVSPVEARTGPPSPSEVTVSWTEAGVLQAATFTPADDAYFIGVRGPSVQIGWADPASPIGYDEITFTTDDASRWRVGEPSGDLTGDGVVNVFDAITILQIIVGLR